jgi:hypothetical protein
MHVWHAALGGSACLAFVDWEVTVPTTPWESQDWEFETALGLRLRVSFRADGQVFDDFFRGYDQAFVLRDEKEDQVGFRRCFALNHGSAYSELEQRYGAFREVCLVADDIATGARVGGANLVAVLNTACVTTNLNYLYVDEGVRRQGYFARLSQGVRELTSLLFGERITALVFIEQNDPLAMSREAYARDTQFTGLDQFERLRIWAKAGARIVDFPYVQPALSLDRKPDSTLVYSAYGAPSSQLDAGVLLGHLRSYFGISVLKGAPLETDAEAVRQLSCLEQMRAANEPIALLDPIPTLERLSREPRAREFLSEPPRTFRDAVKQLTRHSAAERL